MKSDFIYYPSCPNGHATPLLEATLKRIAQGLLELRKAELPISFVCQRCMQGFAYDWSLEPAAGVIESPHQIVGREYERLLSVIVGCGDKHCDFREELIAINSADTTDEEILRATAKWDLSAFHCQCGRQLKMPEHIYLRPVPFSAS